MLEHLLFYYKSSPLPINLFHIWSPFISWKTPGLFLPEVLAKMLPNQKFCFFLPPSSPAFTGLLSSHSVDFSLLLGRNLKMGISPCATALTPLCHPHPLLLFTFLPAFHFFPRMYSCYGRPGPAEITQTYQKWNSQGNIYLFIYREGGRERRRDRGRGGEGERGRIPSRRHTQHGSYDPEIMT